jgi:hypothetical protein
MRGARCLCWGVSGPAARQTLPCTKEPLGILVMSARPRTTRACALLAVCAMKTPPDLDRPLYSGMLPDCRAVQVAVLFSV